MSSALIEAEKSQFKKFIENMVAALVKIDSEET